MTRDAGQCGSSPYGMVTAVAERVGEIAEARPEHDADRRNLGHPRPDRVSRFFDLVVVAHPTA